MNPAMPAVAPWFDPSLAWLPGALLGALGGVWGALAGVLLPMGRGKNLVLGLGSVLLGVGVVLLLAGVFAWFAGQPFAVWYGLGLAGLIATLVLGINVPMMAYIIRAIEQRRIQALDVKL